MQVLNGGDFEQKNVLIGGGKTEAFGVTNDPVLMNMLSTGLYQKPMRTMIQETMFNAWDAHRMGNCQDRPIDIYINDTSGLIIRDYGPGIHKEEIHPIYCIYGNSTKRDNDALTGGFGLGSKSPYAYTDSFTVTSHHEGFKGMYIMNRVSEENDGGPGRSIIFEDVATDESGLVVTIPLKSESDRHRAYEYIKELMYLSGIKANIHFEDRDVETIEADSVDPGEWVVDDEKTSELWAIYGGVRYKIVDDEAYTDEYRFVSKMARMLGTLYIGFKPSTLSPLPSREGLNLNTKTVEAIKNQLEIMEENFRAMLTPATRTALKEAFKSLKESGVEPKFLVEAWVRVGERKKLDNVIDSMHPVHSACYEQCPEGMNESMWISLINLCFKRTDDIDRLLGGHKFDQMKYVVWAKNFPDHKEYRDYIMDRGNSRKQLQTASMIERPRTAAELIEVKKICDEATGWNNDLRYPKGDNWEVLTNVRTINKRNLNERQKGIIEALGGKAKPKTVYDRLWFKRDSKDFNEVLLTKTIIIAKTLGALKDTRFSYQAMFTQNYPEVSQHHNFHRSNFSGDYYYETNERPVAAIVVHQKKGGYEKAMKALEDAGYTVYEADEPQPREKPVAADGTVIVPQPRAEAVYPLYDPSQSDWADWDNEVPNPSVYLCVTEHKVRNAYGYDLPDKSLLAYVYQNTPRMVIIHNKSRVTKKLQKNAMAFEDKLHQMVEKMLSNSERVEKMLLHREFHERSDLPEKIRALPEVQKFFKVPYLRTKEKERFAADLYIIKRIKETYRNAWVHHETKELIRKSFHPENEPDSVRLVREYSDKCNLFNGSALKSHVRDMKPGEVKVFSEKLMRFLRTV